MEVWYVLPALRKALAEEMLKLGLKQTEIAEKLHVTNAAVSQYLKSKRASEIKLPSQIRKTVSASAQKVAKTGNALAEIQKLCALIRTKGVLCQIHKRHSNHNLKNCKVCM